MQAAGVQGTTDATGPLARFDSPSGIALDSSGNVYVTDFNQHTIRKISPAGVVTTFAGTPGVSGSTDSPALFNAPNDVAVDSAGNVYVADYNSHTVRKITSAGVVSTIAGAAGSSGYLDSPTGTSARFNGVSGLTVDSANNVYVAEYVNHTIRKITPAGVVTTIAGLAGTSGSTDASGTSARFNSPQDVAADGSGNLYVADSSNFTIRKITPAGAVTTIAGAAGIPGSLDSPIGASARFGSSALGASGPTGLALDSAGNIFVADFDNNTIRKISSAGAVTTVAGTAGISGSADGTGAAARFRQPYFVAVDSAGKVYVVDQGNRIIRKIN